MKIIAIIPARSGSERIPHKNIQLVAGKPMLVHSIIHAQQTRQIDKIIVSTDSAEYAKIANEYNGETPFLRPAKYSKDNSTDLDVFLHALWWLKKYEQYMPDICVHLRPTYPYRDYRDIENMIEFLIKRPDFDSIRSVSPAPDPAHKMWFIDGDNVLIPAVKSDIPEAHNLPRQLLPQTYIQNAAIDVVWTKTILEKKSMTGRKILGYIMDNFYDIDEKEHLWHMNQKMAQQEIKKILIKAKNIYEKFKG